MQLGDECMLAAHWAGKPAVMRAGSTITTMPPKFIPDKPADLPIPAGSMRVAPGSDAVVWLTAPKHGGEL